MSSVKKKRRAQQLSNDVGSRLRLECAILAARLAQFLSTSLPRSGTNLAEGIAFLFQSYDSISPGRPVSEWSTDPRERLATPPHPLDRLAHGFALSALELQLLLLAGLPEEHEGLAAALRAVHPRAEGRPTAGLAAQLMAEEGVDREVFRSTLEAGKLVQSGLVRLTDDAPFFERTLQIADSLWSVLHGVDVWPVALAKLENVSQNAGLTEWLDSEPARRATNAIKNGDYCTIIVGGDNELTSLNRGVALVTHSGATPVGIALAAAPDTTIEKLIAVHSIARGVVPVLKAAPADGNQQSTIPTFKDFPGVVVGSNRFSTTCALVERPLLEVPVERMSLDARQEMWRTSIPSLSADAPILATRYTVEPSTAAGVANDIALIATLEQRVPTVTDVVASMRARGTVPLSAGVRMVRPYATWSDLVLPEDRLELLQEAVSRYELQAKVFDEWSFLKGRPGARGVRLLFAGPPGTGKTLSAEVVAHALNLDLLVVDLSRVVSKWIGETEKNLSTVFDAAEGGQAALFFDEADALFGKRTEVTDAHDRYANLETAYLLTRLEQFEGLAILATNLRQNLDAAFLRRLEFVVDFEEPDREERCALWKCHLPDDAPLSDDVNLFELASLYPVVGGVIRNAAVAAGFLAAADRSSIDRNHLVHAIRREYAKAGRSFPGAPIGLSVR